MREHRSEIRKTSEVLLRWSPFIAAVAFRLLTLHAFVACPYFMPLGGDRGLYHDAAVAFSNGEILTDVFTFLPLYPWLLAKTYAAFGGPNPAIAAVIHAILDGFTAMMVFDMANRRYGKTAGFIAGMGFAFLGAAAVYSLVSMPVSLGLFWTALTATLSDRWAGRLDRFRALIMGLMLGIGGHILPAFWLMIVPFGILAAFSRPAAPPLRRFSRGLALIIFGYSCLLPTLAHNAIFAGKWAPLSAHGGLNLFIGNNPNAKGYGTAIPGARTSARELTRDSISIASKASSKTLDTAEADRFWRNAAMRFWKENPRQAIELLAKKAHRLASFRDFDDTGLCRLLPEAVPGLRTGFVGFGIVWLLACAGFPWRIPRCHNPALWIIAGGFAAGILLTFVTARYRLPLAVILMPAAAGTLTALPSFFPFHDQPSMQTGKIRRLNSAFLFKLTVSVAGIALALIPHPLPDVRLQDDLNRSAHFLRHGNQPKSLFFAERASSQFPWSDEAWFALGNALFSAGDHPSALKAYERTLTIAPDRPDAMFNLAMTLEALNRMPEATDLYQRLTASDPGNAKAWFRLAVALSGQDDPEGALQAISRAAEIAGYDHPQINAFLRMEPDPYEAQEEREKTRNRE